MKPNSRIKILLGLLAMMAGAAVAQEVAQDSAPAVEPAVETQVQDSQLVPTDHPNPLEDPRDRIYYPGDTERIKPLGRKLFGNILLDQRDIWTSPFRMNRGNAALWLGFGAATAALIITDHDSALNVNSSRISLSNSVSNIGASYTLVPLIAGFYGFGVFRDDPKAREVGVLGTEALLDSLIVSSILKPIAGRNRPDAPEGAGHFFQGGSSFPSGHAMQSWAVASLISYEYGHTKVVPIVAVGLAAIVSTARFTADKHYASDIIAGGAMGWFIGRYVWKTHQDHAIHTHSAFSPSVMPRVVPSTRTYGVTLAFAK